MAENTNIAQAVGKVFILHGTVKAVTVEGIERVLAPNSPIFANDRIMTGNDGSVSITFNSPDQPQLDLGRMSDITIDEDVFDTKPPEDVSDAATKAQDIQAAIESGEFNPETDLPAPAAGDEGPASADGGTVIVKMDLTAQEVTPNSGVETDGPVFGFANPDGGVIEEVLPSLPSLSIDDVTIREPQSFSFDGGEGYDARESGVSVDHWFFTHNGGDFTADILTEYGDHTDDYTDINSDGQQTPFDAYLRLYTVDSNGNPSLYSIASDDDSGSEGATDGSLSGLDSFLDYAGLPAGNYMIAVGNYSLNNDEVHAGVSDGKPGPYQITFHGDIQLTSTPDSSVFQGGDGVITATSTLVPFIPTAIATFTVTMDAPSDVDVTVDFTTADGTAISGGTGVGESDYRSTSGTVTILAGETSATIEVTIYGDLAFEGNESFLVTLSDPVYATIADGQGVGTILDSYESPTGNPDEAFVMEGDYSHLFNDYSPKSVSVEPPPNLDPRSDNNMVYGNVLYNDDPGTTPIIGITSVSILDDTGNPIATVPVDNWPPSGGPFDLGADTPQGGHLVIFSNGEYYYWAPENVDHSSREPIPEVFQYTIIDEGGATAISTLTINIEDDVPVVKIEMESDFVSVEEESAVEVGNDEADGLSFTKDGDIKDNVDWGADNFGAVTIINIGASEHSMPDTTEADSMTIYFGADGTSQGTTAIGAAASLLVNDDGTYTFTVLDAITHAAAGEDWMSNFPDISITATDGDGDPVSIGLQLYVQDDIPEVDEEAEVAREIVYVEEESVPSLDGNDETDDGYSFTHNGDISVHPDVNWGADNFGAVTMVIVDGSEHIMPDTTEPDSMIIYFAADGSILDTGTGAAASLLVNDNGTYTFTVLDAMTHDGAGENWLSNFPDISITATDGDGDQVSIDLELNVQDDVPIASDDAGVTIIDGGEGHAIGNVLSNDSSGADAPIKVTGITGIEGYDYDVDGSEGSIRGDHGTLTIDENGNYDFHLDSWRIPNGIEKINGDDFGEDGYEGSIPIYGGQFRILVNDVDNGTGFTSLSDPNDPESNPKLNIDSLTESDDAVVFKGNNAKSGIGVQQVNENNGQTTGPSTVEDGEALVFQFDTPIDSFQISLAQGNLQQPTEGSWYAFNDSGDFVGTGSFKGALTNGDYSVVVGETESAFTYLLVTDPGGSNGFVVSELLYSDDNDYNIVTDTFEYEITDNDGDTDTATLTIESLVDDDCER